MMMGPLPMISTERIELSFGKGGEVLVIWDAKIGKEAEAKAKAKEMEEWKRGTKRKEYAGSLGNGNR